MISFIKRFLPKQDPKFYTKRQLDFLLEHLVNHDFFYNYHKDQAGKL